MRIYRENFSKKKEKHVFYEVFLSDHFSYFGNLILCLLCRSLSKKYIHITV